MLEVPYIVKFFFVGGGVEICIFNKSALAWTDTIDYYIGSYIGIMLVGKLHRSDAIRNVFVVLCFV